MFWLLDKLGYNKLQQKTIMKVIWKVMAVAFVCAMTFGFYAMVVDMLK